jgi:hypothetical protein
MTHTDRLAILATHGWTCEHPNETRIYGQDKDHKPHQSVFIQGILEGVLQEGYLTLDCGLVLLWGLPDWTFEEFFAVLEGRAVVEAVESSWPKQLEMF